MIHVVENVVEMCFGNELVQEVMRGVWKLTERTSCYNLEKKRMKSY